MRLDFTSNDRLVLSTHRLERLRSFFPEILSSCKLRLDATNTLTIDCAEPWMVDQLLAELMEFGWYAWIVVGAYQVAVCFAQEEIHREITHEYTSRPRQAKLYRYHAR